MWESSVKIGPVRSEITGSPRGPLTTRVTSGGLIRRARGLSDASVGQRQDDVD